MACSDHGSDALMWAAGRGDSEHALLEELITLSGGASINHECRQGDTALTIACSRREKNQLHVFGDSVVARPVEPCLGQVAVDPASVSTRNTPFLPPLI